MSEISAILVGAPYWITAVVAVSAVLISFREPLVKWLLARVEPAAPREPLATQDQVHDMTRKHEEWSGRHHARLNAVEEAVDEVKTDVKVLLDRSGRRQ